jgi:PTS system mannose-specific IIA component
MIGVIIVGHGSFAYEIVSIAENIMGKQEYFEPVSVKVGEREDDLRNKLDAVLAMSEIDSVLVLSDIFGGSFSNACMYFAKNRGRIGVVTGVNLPMVLKVLTHRKSITDLGELVTLACSGGKDGILDACHWLDKKTD